MKARLVWRVAALAMATLPARVPLSAQADPPERDSARPVVVASKPFAESYLLAELFAQTLEARGIPVVRRPGLGATEVAFQALVQGSVDVYPEYTGTGLLAVLGRDAPAGRTAAFALAAAEFRDRWGLRWLPPLGFENAYAIAIRRATADSLRLRTLSDLARVGGGLVAGFSPDFIGRSDGLSGLSGAYGLAFRDVRPLLQALKYQALAQHEVDVIDGYATDGLIDRHDLVVLEDDRDFFPPYDAAALVGRSVAEQRPDVVAALTELSGRLDEGAMRALNRRVEVDQEPVRDVAADALRDLGLVEAPHDRDVSVRQRDSFAAYLWDRRETTIRLALRHLLLVSVSLGAALLVAVPLGLILERTRSVAEGTIRIVGLFQTIPSIALLAFMIPVLGIGFTPAVVALFLYSLLPIVRNTFAGVRDADPVAVDAARALGMTGGQLLVLVRLPLAAPVIMAGVRTAAVINVGTATLAAFIGAGGLGEPIVTGLALSDARLILAGAVPAAVLALLVEGVLSVVERALAPRGLEASRGA